MELQHNNGSSECWKINHSFVFWPSWCPQSSSNLFYPYQAGSVCEIRLVSGSSSDWTISVVTVCWCVTQAKPGGSLIIWLSWLWVLFFNSLVSKMLVSALLSCGCDYKLACWLFVYAVAFVNINCSFCSVAGWCLGEVILDFWCLFSFYLPSQWGWKSCLRTGEGCKMNVYKKLHGNLIWCGFPTD